MRDIRTGNDSGERRYVPREMKVCLVGVPDLSSVVSVEGVVNLCNRKRRYLISYPQKFLLLLTIPLEGLLISQ